MKQTQELIDVLAPDHSRTSCGDNDLCNHVIIKNNKVKDPGRCTRCSLMYLAKSDCKVNDIDLFFQLG